MQSHSGYLATEQNIWFKHIVGSEYKEGSGRANKVVLITMQKKDTPKNVLFPGHNHLLTTGTDDLTL